MKKMILFTFAMTIAAVSFSQNAKSQQGGLVKEGSFGDNPNYDLANPITEVKNVWDPERQTYVLRTIRSTSEISNLGPYSNLRNRVRTNQEILNSARTLSGVGAAVSLLGYFLYSRSSAINMNPSGPCIGIMIIGSGLSFGGWVEKHKWENQISREGLENKLKEEINERKIKELERELSRIQ